MIIKIINKTDNNSLSPLLLEAEQDDVFVTLKDCKSTETKGLFCGGLAVCYGVIIKSKHIALAHVSSIDDTSNKEFFNLMIQEASNNGEFAFEIILARSYYGYDSLRAFDISNGHDDFNKTADEYFNLADKGSIAFFEKNFSKTPSFKKLPHDFFIIEINEEIQLFEKYPPSTIDFEEVSIPTPIPSKGTKRKGEEETDRENEDYKRRKGDLDLLEVQPVTIPFFHTKALVEEIAQANQLLKEGISKGFA